MATRKTTDGFVTPTLHLNGSGYRNLSDQYNDAYTALTLATNTLARTAPHERDYYICDKSGEAYEAARRQHEELQRQLEAVRTTVGSMLRDVEEQEMAHRSVRGGK